MKESDVSDWQEFFEYQNRLNFGWDSISQYSEVTITAEDLYQHFKARMISEISVLEVLLSDNEQLNEDDE